MLTSKTRWTLSGLAGLGLGVLLLPVFGEAVPDTPLRATGNSVPILGAVLAKAPPLEVISARDLSFPQAGLRDATGDTYDAAGLAQDAIEATYVDEYPDNHTFGTGDETAGVNLFSDVDTRIAGMDQGPGLPGTNFLQVNYYTSDSSDIVPAGTASTNGPFIAWRFDVGTTAAGTDKINWTPNPGFTVVDSGFCLAEDGVVLGCADLALHDSDANGVSGAGVVGLEGDVDIAGYGVDEMIMYWEIQLASSSYCGDGNLDPGEECDDGNTVDGDGCSSICEIEPAGPADFDEDGDVDLADFAVFQSNFEGP